MPTDQVAEVDRAVSDLADLIAKNRTGGAVFMGGEHRPRPSEERAAREFISELLRRGWRLPASDQAAVGTKRCSGCYDSFSGPWCDNCDTWPCKCTVAGND